MRMATIGSALLLTGAAMISGSALAGPMIKPVTSGSKTTARAAHLPKAAPNAISVVHSQITINKKVLHYTVTTGYMPIKSHGKLQAHIFFIAYTKDPTPGISVAVQRDRRPITFLFNGGPGAASNWLNLGCAGPMRVKLTPTGNVTPPPYKLVPNHQTWLTASDLVFVDPVGTGFSRIAPGVSGKNFYGVRQDIASVATFIRLYTTMYQRWGSTKFLAGESYGTTRACGLADFLSAHDGMTLNGVILISCALNFQILIPRFGNDTPYPLFLPSYTAAAWYHHKLAPDLEKHFHRTLKKVEHWALTDYISALAQGSNLSTTQRHAVAAKLARYTGLSEREILLANLRIGPGLFEQSLLRNQRRVIGRMDTRLTGYNPNPTAGSAPYDPALSRFIAPFTSALDQYVREDLKYRNNLPYKTLSDDVYPWHFGTGGMGYLDVADNLQRAMIRNPFMKVLVCSGYFDLATPFFGTIYTMDHLDLSRKLQKNIREVFFHGGHMVYHPAPMRIKLAQVVSTFITTAAQ
ncbi:MAG: peptidase S10 [Planctomycetia bacterium]|nr:peptidase S10 [Planctomycetia bacterium]